eukprot:2601940-Rhodomonas_salina.1
MTCPVLPCYSARPCPPPRKQLLHHVSSTTSTLARPEPRQQAPRRERGERGREREETGASLRGGERGGERAEERGGKRGGERGERRGEEQQGASRRERGYASAEEEEEEEEEGLEQWDPQLGSTPPMLLRTSYAMLGTDLRYAPIPAGLSPQSHRAPGYRPTLPCYQLPGTDSAYAPTRYWPPAPLYPDPSDPPRDLAPAFAPRSPLCPAAPDSEVLPPFTIVASSTADAMSGTDTSRTMPGTDVSPTSYALSGAGVSPPTYAMSGADVSPTTYAIRY